jgi:hypothetical protein
MTGQRREVRARGRPRKVEPEQGRAIEVR